MTYIPCPRCTGTGHIRSTESAALHILRILEEESMKENTGALHVQIPVDVATFLLNEKRDDIRTIELRHKVNIVLIPNTHLETPAHEIIRLRHDQLNQEDQALPSYKMVEAPPTEAYQPPSAQTEARPSRPEAAVKGITPSQPAPIFEPKPAAQPAQATQPSAAAQPGIIDKIFGWFRGNRKAEPASVAKAEPPARREQTREGRGERGRGRDRGERGRQEPRDRQEQRQRGQQTPRPEQEGRGERRPRQERPDRQERGERAERQGQEPRQPRQPRQQEQRPPQPQSTESPIAPMTGVQESSAPGAATELQEERRGRRGRRGRGRDRGERRPEEQSAEAGQTVAEQPAIAPEPMPQAAEQAPLAFDQTTSVPEAAPAPVPLPAEDKAVEAALASSPAETALAPVPVAELPMPVEEVAEPAPAPVVAIEPTFTPKVMPAPVKPQIDISVALQESGLVMVETSREKAPVSIPAEPEVRLGRKPKAPVVISNEPLKQVETHK
jgi:ribonuclease E